jgi:hypothetical protein
MGLIVKAGAAPLKFGDAARTYAPFAGLPAALLFVADNPDVSRQIPPACTVDPKLSRPAIQLDSLLSSGDGFVAGELAVAPRRGVVPLPDCDTPFCWLAAGCICALARPGRRTAANTATQSAHPGFAPLMVYILLRPADSWQSLKPP